MLYPCMLQYKPSRLIFACADGCAGDGHFSPIGGFHAQRDLVLILDTARFKYAPHWVRVIVDVHVCMCCGPGHRCVTVRASLQSYDRVDDAMEQDNNTLRDCIVASRRTSPRAMRTPNAKSCAQQACATVCYAGQHIDRVGCSADQARGRCRYQCTGCTRRCRRGGRKANAAGSCA